MLDTLRQIQRKIRNPRQFFFDRTTLATRRAAFRIGNILDRDSRSRRRALGLLDDATHLSIPEVSGFRAVEPGRIAGIPSVVTEASRFLNELGDRGPGSGTPKTIQTKLDRAVGRWNTRKASLYQRPLTPDDLQADSPILRFALDSVLIGSIARYLGGIPILNFAMLGHSQHVGDVGGSQLFHGDGETYSQVKVFVYLADVDEKNGPFTMVGAGNSELLARRLGYRWGDRISDEVVGRMIAPSDVHSVTGPAGTVLFVDTSRCLHFGSRVLGPVPRSVLMYQYLLPVAKRVDAPFARLANDQSSELERLILRPRG